MAGVARKRRRTQNRVHYYGSEDQDFSIHTDPTEQRHHHTSFVARASRISAHTSFVSARHLAANPPIPEDSGSTAGDAPEPRGEEDVNGFQFDEEAFETLNPESFLDFNDYVEETKRRKRTAGVSGFSMSYYR